MRAATVAAVAPALFRASLAVLLGCAGASSDADVIEATTGTVAPRAAASASERPAETKEERSTPRDAGAQDEPGASTAPRTGGGFRLVYRQTGGFAGIDVSFIVDGDGTMRHERRRPASARKARLDPGDAQKLRELVHDSGFLELGSRYAPATDVADGFEYVLRWEEPGVMKEIAVFDGAKVPDAFARVLDLVQALERKTLAEPAVEEIR